MRIEFYFEKYLDSEKMSSYWIAMSSFVGHVSRLEGKPVIYNKPLSSVRSTRRRDNHRPNASA